jgi:hypothetical protein
MGSQDTRGCRSSITITMLKMQTFLCESWWPSPAGLGLFCLKGAFLGLQSSTCPLRKSWDGFAKKSHTSICFYPPPGPTAWEGRTLFMINFPFKHKTGLTHYNNKYLTD